MNTYTCFISCHYGRRINCWAAFWEENELKDMLTKEYPDTVAIFKVKLKQ